MANPAYSEQITINYVNARQGRRPASISDQAGNYYTISDAAYQSGMFQPNQQGMMHYTVSGRGFRYAKTWNGINVPEDPRQGQQQPQQQPPPQQGYQQPPPQQGYQQPPPQANPPAQPQQRLTAKDKLIIRGGIAKSCIETGGTPEDAARWWNWTMHNRISGQPAPADTNPIPQGAAPPEQGPEPEPEQAGPPADFDDEIPF